jgi:hypothetical protein
VKAVRLKVRDQNGEIVKTFIIRSRPEGADIRRECDSPIEADRTAPIDIDFDHCKVCIQLPDEQCDANVETFVLEVESADA